ncbi:MAG: protein kinase [Myxococcota bacterium]
MTGTQIIGSISSTDHPVAFGKYRVLTLLGSGGFGSVYKCHDEALGRDVAVKALSPEVRDQQDLRERFLREARALARVSHPCVVQVFDVGEAETGPFFVMELVGGRDLSRVLAEEGPLPEKRVLQLCRQAVTGLQAAWAAGVVHRDIKPANLLVSGRAPQEQVKVSDFGVAYPQGRESDRLTAPTTILGTPEYISPEQARAGEVDFRADMYSLGCSMFELLTGSVPFSAATPQALIAAHLTQAPEPPRVRVPTLSAAVNNMVVRLLSKEASARYASYDELLNAMDVALNQTASLTVPISAPLSQPNTSPLPNVMRVDSGSTSVQTENLAICFVELLDFDERVRQQTRAENEEWTGTFSDGMKRLIRSRGGRFIKQVYGTVLCTFGSPTDAVLFGMSCADSAWEWSRGKPPEMSYRLRVGVNMGEVRVDRGDIFGDPVNVAARVMAQAEPGQVYFSDAVYLAMNRSEVETESMGARELKGVPVPVRIFKALPRKGHTPGENVVPFGVGSAVPSTSGGMEALKAIDAGARAVVGTVGAAVTGARKVGGALAPVASATGTVAKGLWQRIPGRHRKKIAVGVPGVVLLGVLAVGVPRWTDPYRREIALLEEGKAAAAARALETRAPEMPRAQWLYAKALLASGKPSDCLRELDEALTRDAKLAHDESFRMAAGALDVKDKLATRILVKHFGIRFRDEMKELTTSERYWVRHHAADALEELNLESDVDQVALGLKDIRVETECSRRREGIRIIEDEGTEKALAALGAARDDPGGDPGCVSDALNSAERRLKKKLGAGKP